MYYATPLSLRRTIPLNQKESSLETPKAFRIIGIIFAVGIFMEAMLKQIATYPDYSEINFFRKTM
jgi:hypothetical protein